MIWKPTDNTHVHVSTTCLQERGKGAGNSFAASLMMYLAPRTAEHGSSKLYPHSVTCFLIPKYQLNPEITPCLCPREAGKEAPSSTSIHCTGSICLLQALAAVSKCLFKVMYIHPRKIRQDKVPGHKRTDRNAAKGKRPLHLT